MADTVVAKAATDKRRVKTTSKEVWTARWLLLPPLLPERWSKRCRAGGSATAS